jgi:hypothetical protein
MAGERFTHFRVNKTSRRCTMVLTTTPGSFTVPPLIIWAGQKLPLAVVDAGFPPGSLTGGKARFAVNDSGGMTNEMGVTWLKECFIPALKHPDKPAILICDGHGSHLAYDFVRHCRENNIHIIARPPHTSHVLQPEGAVHAHFPPARHGLSACRHLQIHGSFSASSGGKRRR